MRRAAALLIICGLILSGCGEEVDQARRNSIDPGGGGRGKTQFGEKDVEYLKAISGELGNANTALKAAPGKRSNSEKLGKMIERVEARCLQNGEVPPNKFDRNWKGVAEFQSHSSKAGQTPPPPCPVSWHQERSFNLSTRTWTMIEKYSANTAEYRGFNDVLGRYSDGSIKLIFERGRFLVQGKIKYTNLQFQQFGKGRGEATIKMDEFKNAARILLTFKLEMPSRMVYNAAIEWRESGNLIGYRVNNTNVERKLFDEMFGAFGLDELMDVARGIR